MNPLTSPRHVTTFAARVFFGRFMAITAMAGMSGCASINRYLSDAPKPTAHVVAAHLANLEIDSASLIFDVEIHNPYDVALPLANADYTLASGGKPFLSGNAPVQGSIPSKGTMTVPLPAKVSFAPLLTAVGGITPGSVVPYDAKMTLSVNAPVIGTVSLPLSASGQIPIPALPGIELTDVQWTTLDLSKAQATLHIKITNNNQFELDLAHLDVNAGLAGHSVGAVGLDQAVNLPAGAAGQVDVPIAFSPASFGLSALSILRGKGADYSLKGALAGSTPYGPITLPYDKSGSTRLH